MLQPDHVRHLVVRPVLEYLAPEIPYSEAAENLLMGTAVHESRLTYLKQLNGPALGLFQIEPDTHDDIWENFLAYKPDLSSKIRALASQKGHEDAFRRDLTTNLAYQAAMARVLYYRRPEALPKNEPESLAEFWKQHYNTPLGAGTVEQFIRHYKEV